VGCWVVWAVKGDVYTCILGCRGKGDGYQHWDEVEYFLFCRDGGAGMLGEHGSLGGWWNGDTGLLHGLG
jgi:hypothetical protein